MYIKTYLLEDINIAMSNEKPLPQAPETAHRRSRSFSFGWNPALGGFPKLPQNNAQQGSIETPPVPLAIPKARTASMSSMTDYGSEESSFKETSLPGFARRGSVSASFNPMFRRRPSIDEERILKGEFSF